MNRKQGFTLVELLVVIAIITILASIVVPRVTDAIGRARMARAVSEIRGAELAVNKMLADVDKQSIDKMFDSPPGVNILAQAALSSEKAVEEFYSKVFYELLRQGKNADFSFSSVPLQLHPTVRRKLGTVYMDMPMDPWGTNPYFFFAGPLTIDRDYTNRPFHDIFRFRCYRDVSEEEPYVYDLAQKNMEDNLMRGNPAPDGFVGYPCPRDLPVYVFSYGANEECDQPVVLEEYVQGKSGGDDVNNWDNASGWSAFY